MKKTLLPLLLILFLTATAFAQSTSPTNTKLDEQVKNLISTFKGKVSLYAKNLDTGETYAVNADERDLVEREPMGLG